MLLAGGGNGRRPPAPSYSVAGACSGKGDPYSIDEDFTAPYRYDWKVNEVKNRDVVSMPEVASFFNKFVYKYSAALTISKLRLEYVPLAEDLIGTAGIAEGSGSRRKDGEAFLAESGRVRDDGTGGDEYFTHGNSRIVLFVDDVDRSDFFAPIGFQKDWEKKRFS
jgi:hypothetical protein